MNELSPELEYVVDFEWSCLLNVCYVFIFVLLWFVFCFSVYNLLLGYVSFITFYVFLLFICIIYHGVTYDLIEVGLINAFG